MKLIPYQYQELEDIYNCMLDNKARCVTLLSVSGNTGATTLCLSLARSLEAQNSRVLVIDLNPLNPHPISIDSDDKNWQFDDISCQLNVIEHDNYKTLTIKNLREFDSAKNRDVLKESIERLLQEFDYVLIDMSPAVKINKGNVPLQALSLCSDLTILTVGIGYNDESSLVNSVKNLEQAGHKNIKLVVSHHGSAPLGTRMINSLDKYSARFPRLTNYFKKKVKAHKWLFHPH